MRALLSIGLVAAMASSAAAEELVFRPMVEESPEYAMVRSYVPEGDVISALVDLNGDDRMEFVSRVGDDCEEAYCRTVAFAEVGSDWRLVLDKTALDVEVGEPGNARMKTLYVDGVAWTWRTTAYAANVAASGEPVSLSLVPSDYVQPLLEQFGAGAVKLFEDNSNAELTYGSLTPGDGLEQLIVVKLSGAGACGRVYGCPIRLLAIRDGAYVPVLEGFADGEIVLGNVLRDGRRDVIASLPGNGFIVYGWSGSVYGQVDSFERN